MLGARDKTSHSCLNFTSFLLVPETLMAVTASAVFCSLTQFCSLLYIFLPKAMAILSKEDIMSNQLSYWFISYGLCNALNRKHCKSFKYYFLTIPVIVNNNIQASYGGCMYSFLRETASINSEKIRMLHQLCFRLSYFMPVNVTASARLRPHLSKANLFLAE